MEHSRNISVDQPITYTEPCWLIVQLLVYNITKKRYQRHAAVSRLNVYMASPFRNPKKQENVFDLW